MNYKGQKYTDRIFDLKYTLWPCKSAHCCESSTSGILCHSPAHQGGKELIPNTMGQTKQARGLASLSRATDTLSTLLAQQVRELNARQKAAKRKAHREQAP